MAEADPTVISPFEGPWIDIFGQQARVLFDGSTTNGASSAVSQECPPGSVVPPHTHAGADELFHILDGDFEFWLEGRWTPVSAGSMIYAPRGLMHGFRNVGDTAGRLVAVYTPAGFEQLLVEIGKLVDEERLSPESLEAVNRRYDVVTLDEREWQSPEVGW